MSPAVRLALTVSAAILAAGITVAVAARVSSAGPVTAYLLPVALLLAAALVRLRR